MALIGVMTAVTCILDPLFAIPIPISPVPISFTNLAVYLTVYVLGNEGRNDKLSYLSAPWLPDFPYFQALQAVCKAGRANGRLSGWIYFYGSHSGLVH